MHFLIYGAGALGQAIGCMLAADGHQVDLVLRPRYMAHIESEGLRVTGIFGEYRVAPGKLGLLPNLQGQDGRNYDYILLTTKTYGSDIALQEIEALANCSCPVVSLQNGCGNLEKLEQHFGPVRSLAARVITGFAIEEQGVVKITVSADAIHVGGCTRGEIPAAATDFAAALAHAGMPSIAVADVYQSLFAKLLYNCALNPLGAILGVHYGALAESVETRAIMDRVMEETFAVIAAMGGTTPWQDVQHYRRVFYEQLVPATFDHRSSMLQDLENNKPTEVDSMVGYVTAQGLRYQVPTPCCAFLAALVRFKEQSARNR